MTHAAEQERAEFEDGAWYWVEKDGWYDEPPKIAPAMYRAACDAWYSWEFSGVSTQYLKVLEPCTRHEQAARRAPAVPVPQGWQPVPIEPTQEMQDAMHTTGHAPTRYAAMLAAAPQPPEPDMGIPISASAPAQLPEIDIDTANHAGIRVRGYTQETVRQLLADQQFKLDELAMLTRMVVHAFRKVAPDNKTAAKAVDYLKRKGLQGNPLRSLGIQEQRT